MKLRVIGELFLKINNILFQKKEQKGGEFFNAQKLGKKVINAYFKSTSSNYLKHTCDKSFCADEIIGEVKE